jgi:hypothetical protein
MYAAEECRLSAAFITSPAWRRRSICICLCQSFLLGDDLFDLFLRVDRRLAPKMDCAETPELGQVAADKAKVSKSYPRGCGGIDHRGWIRASGNPLSFVRDITSLHVRRRVNPVFM